MANAGCGLYLPCGMKDLTKEELSEYFNQK